MIDEYKAYNLLTPFTKRVDHELQGYLISLIRNQNVTKKSQFKGMDELLPFLKGELKKELEHELVNKAFMLFGNTRTVKAKEHLIKTIDETIVEEYGKEDRDDYLISRLYMVKARVSDAILSQKREEEEGKE
ncbi:hypothetical protein V0242_11800 [Aeromonas hydrophila]|uniref:hypothetical protein n=1 Tax=Aeromonas hydrophila TaxID=644 RepID=UPI002ED51885|nr:hypothetical protein V0242_11800 [Aeromonas hydrophila]